MKRLLSLVFVFSIASGLAAQTCGSVGANPAVGDWYVDANATNSIATGTKSDPFMTIGTAYAVADDNDRIFVAPGVYAPSTGETYPYQFGSNAAVSQLGVQIIGTGGAAVTVIDGENIVSSGFGLLRFRRLASGAKIRGFTLTNYAGTLGAIRLGSTSSGFEAHDVEISHCIIENSAGSGIATFGASSALKIHNNLFRNNGDNAVWLSDITANTNPCNGATAGGEVYNNTFDGNNNGIRVQGGTWSIYNNIIVNSTVNGVFDFGLVGFPSAVGLYTLNHNCMSGNATAYAGGLAGGPNAVAGDPMFVSGTDYHLLPGSPCLDAGRLVPNYIGSDSDGDPRRLGGTVDIGMDEANDVSHSVTAASLALPAVQFDVTGPPGDLVVRGYSLGTGNIPFPIQGNFLLDFASLTIIDPVAVSIPASGTLALPVSIAGVPPSAIGTPIWSQALVTGSTSTRFTNVWLTMICP